MVCGCKFDGIIPVSLYTNAYILSIKIIYFYLQHILPYSQNLRRLTFLKTSKHLRRVSTEPLIFSLVWWIIANGGSASNVCKKYRGRIFL